MMTAESDSRQKQETQAKEQDERHAHRGCSHSSEPRVSAKAQRCPWKETGSRSNKVVHRSSQGDCSI